MKYPLMKYQIWIGRYNLGQGYGEPTESQMIDEIEAPNFKVACLLHELRNKLNTIETQIKEDKYVDEQTCRWFYNFDTNSCDWLGKYYESKEEADKSFKP